MINMYELVASALDEAVLGCKVQKAKRDPKASLSISYTMHASIGIQYADDKIQHIEHETQIDIWADYEISIHGTLEKVISLMKAKGFGLVDIRPDMYDTLPDGETLLLHKPIIFKYIEKIQGGM